jgi:hypothetical protein
MIALSTTAQGLLPTVDLRLQRVESLDDRAVQLVMQPQYVDLDAQIGAIVEAGGQPILGRLPVLAHHDDRRLDRRQRRKHQVEEDVWIGIEDQPKWPSTSEFSIHPSRITEKG